MLATLVFLLYVLGAATRADSGDLDAVFPARDQLACWMKGAFLTPLVRHAATHLRARAHARARTRQRHLFHRRKIRRRRNWKRHRQPRRTAGKPSPRKSSKLNSRRAAPSSSISPPPGASPANSMSRPSSKPALFAKRSSAAESSKLKADWTNADPAITKILKQFGRPGVPLYVLYPAGKSAEPIVLPELLTKNIVLEQLETIAPQVATQ